MNFLFVYLGVPRTGHFHFRLGWLTGRVRKSDKATGSGSWLPPETFDGVESAENLGSADGKSRDVRGLKTAGEDETVHGIQACNRNAERIPRPGIFDFDIARKDAPWSDVQLFQGCIDTDDRCRRRAQSDRVEFVPGSVA